MGRRAQQGRKQNSRGLIESAVQMVVEQLEQRMLLSITAPSSLLASGSNTPGLATAIGLQWEDNSNNETSFKVERKTGSGGTWSQIGTANANDEAYNDGTVTAGTQYYYRVRASDGAEDSSYSNESDAIEWTSANVGSASGGSFSVNNGVATLVSNGNGMAGSSDNFRFAYRTLRGDGEIIAKVTSVQWTNPMARAAIMFRNSLASNSRSAFLAIMPNGSAQWSFRRTDGANAQQTNISNQAAPRYVKLVRFGSLITASVSADKVSWTQVGQANITMDENVYVGLALSASEYYGGYNTSTFEEVTASANPNPLPAGWTSQDIGSAPMAGTSRFTDDTYIFTVEGSGQLVGGTSDSLHFAHRTLVGDGEIIAKVTSIVGMDGNPSGYNQYAMAGVMFRDGLAANARTVLMAITGWDGARWQYRSATGGNSTEYKVAGIGVPYWVRIKRVGSDFTGYRSADGTNWTQTGSTVTISNMPSSLEVGLTFNAAAYGSLNTATFEGVKMIPAAPSSLAATPNHAHRIDLSWTDNSSSEDGFSIERRADGGAWQVATTVSGSNAWIDYGVEPGVEYDYRVRAFITGVTGGNSEYSNTASGHTTGLGDGLSAVYFDNTNFTGTTLTRVDERVDFRWDNEVSPGEGIEPPTFAVEWTGQVQTPNETNPSNTYTFNTYSDDGIMVWVNGQLLIDHFDVHAPGSDNATIDLAPNQKYNIRILYFQNAGSGDAHLNWIVPGGSLTPIPTANLFSTILNPPAAPPTPVVTDAEAPGADNPNSDLTDHPRVDLAWQAVAGAERYVIFRSWDQGVTYTVAGSVSASVTQFTDTDEGRYLDGQTTYRYQVMAVSAGGRSQLAEALDGIENVDAYRSGDGAVVTWEANVEGSVRVDRSDDGGTTWVTVADDVNADAGTVVDSSAPAANDLIYVVVMNQPMLEGLPNASDGSLVTATDRVRATYFSGTNLSGTGVDVGMDGFSRNWDDRTPVPGGFSAKNFSARMESSVIVPSSGNYTFHVKANGGVRLYVGGERVVDRWTDIAMFGGDVTEDGAANFFDLTTIAANYGLIPATRAQGDANGDGAVNYFDVTLLSSEYGQQEVPHTVDVTVALQAGQRVPIWVEYFNARTAASLEVTWTVPGGGAAQSIPLEPLGSVVAPYPVEFSVGSGGSVNEGQSTTISLNAAAGIGQDAPVGWWIDWGGTEQYLSSNAKSASHVWADSGAFNIAAWAVGQSGTRYVANVAGSSNTTLSLTVGNLAPSANAGPDQTVAPGVAVTLSGSATDKGTNDTLSYAWRVTSANPNVAAVVGTGAQFTFTPAEAGIYTAELTVTDDDGASATDTMTLTVDGAAWEAAPFGGPSVADEGDVVTFTAPTAAGVSNIWQVSIDEEVVASAEGATLTFKCPDDGEYEVSLITVVGDQATVRSRTLTVVNLPPRNLSIVGPKQQTSGRVAVFGSSVKDPAGTHDPLSYSWSVWRNGSAVTLAAGTRTDLPSFAFTPATAGSYEVRLSVSDDEGAFVSGSYKLVVTAPQTASDQLVTAGIEAANWDQIRGLVIQSDGKIVTAEIKLTPGVQYSLARYTPDLKLDTTFGTGGRIEVPFNSYTFGDPTNPFYDELDPNEPIVWDRRFGDLIQQPDGKIIFGATAVVPPGTGELPDDALLTGFAIARFNVDGTPDSSFGSAGKTIVWDFAGRNIPTGTPETYSGYWNSQAVVKALSLQPDGKIIAGGYVSTDATWNGGHNGNQQASAQFALARLNPDGTVDDTFGTAGTAVTPIGPLCDDLYTQGATGSAISSLAIQPDGKILAGGFSVWDTEVYLDGSTSDHWRGWPMTLARYNPDGQLDPTFGGVNEYPWDFNEGNRVYYSANGYTLLKPWIAATGSGYGNIEEILIQPSTDLASPQGFRIVVVGQSNSSDNFSNGSDVALARLNSQGQLDLTFGSAGTGYVLHNLGDSASTGTADGALSAFQDATGHIWTGGPSKGLNGYDFAIERFTADGVVDNPFETGQPGTPLLINIRDASTHQGTLPNGSQERPDYANVMVFDRDSIVLGGYGYNYAHQSPEPGSATDVALARYYPNMLAAPELSATASAKGTVDLHWSDISVGEDGYVLQRSDDGLTGWTTIDLAMPDSTGYGDGGVESNRTYYYRVAAFRSDPYQEALVWSNIASATTFPRNTRYVLEEIVYVPTDGTTVRSDTLLSEGARYLLTASGLFNLGGVRTATQPDGTYRADAEHGTWYPDVTPIDASRMPGRVDYGIGVNDSILDGSKFPYWGDYDGSNHSYSVSVIGKAVHAITSLTRNGSTATAISVGHGFLVGDQATIAGAAESEYNGTFTVTGLIADGFQFTVTGSPSSPVTTTTGITATYPGGGQPITLNYHDDYFGDNSGDDLEVRIYRALPADPAGLTATADRSAKTISLRWTDASTDETHFVVERSLDGSTWTEYSALPAGTVAFEDHAVDFNKPYRYRVLARNQFGDSGYSNTAVAVLVNHPPDVTEIYTKLAVVGQEFLMQVDAADPDGNTAALTYTLLGQPAGMVVSSSGAISGWTPLTSDGGQYYSFTARVTDQDGATADRTVQVYVSYASPAVPTVSNPTWSLSADGRSVLVHVTATPISGGSTDLRYFWSVVRKPNAVADPVISVANGQNGTAAAADAVIALNRAGGYMFHIAVTDGDGKTAGKYVSFEVLPQLQSLSLTPAQVSVREGDALRFDVRGVDQFGKPMSITPSWAVSGVAGSTIVGGTNSAIATFGAVTTATTATVTASVTGGTTITGTASVVVGNDDVTNTAPTIVSGPTATLSSFPGASPVTGVLSVDARDLHGGLDLESELMYTWTQIDGPAGSPAAIANSNGTNEAKRVGVVFSGTTGTYKFRVVITDRRGLSIQADTNQIVLDAVAPGASVTLTPSAIDGQVGVAIPFAAMLRDAAGRPTVSQPTAFQWQVDYVTVTTAATFSFTPTIKGIFKIKAIDPVSTLWVEATVNVEDVAAPPFITIDGLSDGGGVLELTEDITVRGIVDDPNQDLQSYTLKLIPHAGGDPIILAQGTTEVGSRPGLMGDLGRLRASGVPDGLYTLELSAVDASGHQAEPVKRTIQVRSDVKLGNLNLPLTDLEVAVPGGPSLSVTRVYDSMQANVKGQLGYGWRLEVSDASLRTTSRPSEKSHDSGANTFRAGDLVYLTLPGGQQHVFAFYPKPTSYDPAKPGGPYWYYYPKFVSVDGSGATLRIVNASGTEILDELVRDGDEFYGKLNYQGYNPALTAFGGRYELETLDGTQYTIGASDGKVQKVTDPSGNETQLTGGTSNLVVEAVPGDSSKIRAYDPKGNNPANPTAVIYQLDGWGDLIGVTDRAGKSSTYGYTDRLTAFRALGGTIDAVLTRTTDGKIWNGSDFVTRNDAQWTTYAIALSAVDGKWYTAALPSGISAGTSFDVSYRLRAGATAAPGDTEIGSESGRLQLGAHLLWKISDHAGVTLISAKYDPATRQLIALSDPYGRASTSSGPDFNGSGTSRKANDALGGESETVYSSANGVETTRQIRTVKDSSGRVVKYVVSVSERMTPVSEILDTNDTGRSAMNRTTAETQYLPFEITGADVKGLRYTQKPTIVSASSEYYLTEYADGRPIDANFGMLKSQSLMGPDGLPLITTYSNYERGRAQKVIDPYGTVSLSRYNPDGTLAWTLNSLGEGTSYQHTDGTAATQSAGLPKGMIWKSWRITYSTPITAATDPASVSLTPGAQLSQTTYYASDDPAIGAIKGKIWKSLDTLTGVSTEYTYYANGLTKEVFRKWTVASVEHRVRESYTYYDNEGRVTKVYGPKVYGPGETPVEPISTDPHSETQYDDLGRAKTTIDQFGGQTINTLDSAGNLIQVKYADGTETRTAYDALGRAEWTTDRFVSTGSPAVVTRALFDSVGRTVGSERYTGATISIVADPIAANRFKSQGPDAQALQAAGKRLSATSTEYDAQGRAAVQADAAGTRSQTTYWLDGSVRTSTIGAGTALATTVTSATGLWKANRLTINGAVVTGDVFNVTFASFPGDPLAETVTVTSTSNSIPGVLALLANEINSQNGAIAGKLQATVVEGRYIELTARPTLSFPDFMVKLSVNHPPSSVQPAPSLDASSTLARSSYSADAPGHGTLNLQDSLGRTTKTLFHNGTSTQTFYGAKDTPVSGTLPGGFPTSFQGQHVVKVDQLDRPTHYLYDTSGRLTDVWLPQVEDAANNNILSWPHWSYTYDANGNQLSQTDPKGHTTTFVYDDQGQRTSRTLPGTQTESWTYDSRGRTLTHADFKGQTTAYVYDDAPTAGGRVADEYRFAAGVTAVVGGVVQTASAAERTHYVYDTLGRVKTVQEYAGGVLTRTEFTEYDAITGAVTRTDAPEGAVGHEYDPATGRLIRTFTASNDTRYDYDGLGRPWHVTSVQHNGVTSASPEVTTYTYDAVGNLDKVALPNKLTTDYDYDALNRLVLERVTRDDPSTTAVVEEIPVLRFDYNFFDSTGADQAAKERFMLEKDGQRGGAVETRYNPDGSAFSTTYIDYEYDRLRRLTKEDRDEVRFGTGEQPRGVRDHDDFVAGYTFDLAGNRHQKTLDSADDAKDETITYGYDSDDRLLTEDSTINANDASYTYDDNGSTISRTRNGQTVKYQWNLRNRMVRMDANGDTTYDASGTPLSNAADDTTYAYASDGDRVSQTTAGQITEYLTDKHNLTGYSQTLEEKAAGAATPTVSYVVGQDVIGQARSSQSSTLEYLLYDGHGSTRAVAKAWEANIGITILVADSNADYDAFGNSLTPITVTQFLYSGERYDSGLKMQYLRARYYDQAIGRFSSFDTFEGMSTAPLALHKFVYGSGNPIYLVDPSGHFGIKEILLVALAEALIFTALINVAYRNETGNGMLKGVSDWKARKDGMKIAIEDQQAIRAAKATFMANNDLSGTYPSNSLDIVYDQYIHQFPLVVDRSCDTAELKLEENFKAVLFPNDRQGIRFVPGALVKQGVTDPLNLKPDETANILILVPDEYADFDNLSQLGKRSWYDQADKKNIIFFYPGATPRTHVYYLWDAVNSNNSPYPPVGSVQAWKSQSF